RGLGPERDLRRLDRGRGDAGLLQRVDDGPGLGGVPAQRLWAVAPFVVTPKSNEARSGVASTVPLPVTVIVVPAVGVAERPRCGCATPAIAAATSSTPATRRVVRSLFMPHVRHRRATGHPCSLLQTVLPC